MFGRTDIVLHTADIVRRRGAFEMLKDDELRESFYRRLNQMMGDLSYAVVACAIQKNEHVERYGSAAMNPYMLSLEVLVERFCYEIGSESGSGSVVAERRSPVLDRILEVAWENLKAQGTRFLRPRTVAARIVGLDLQAEARECSWPAIGGLGGFSHCAAPYWKGRQGGLEYCGEQTATGCPRANRRIWPCGDAKTNGWPPINSGQPDSILLHCGTLSIPCGSSPLYGISLPALKKEGQPPINSDQPPDPL